MRPGSVAGEAWRNWTSGTTRAGLFAGVFVAAVGLIAAMDVRSVVGVLRGAADFTAAGAADQVLRADGSIDGRRCDAVAGARGVAAAGATRPGPPVRAWAMPSSQIGTVEATPGFVALLPLLGRDVRTDAGVTDGVWLSSDLADTLGVAPGQVVQTDAGPAGVAGVYTWPDDGRARELGYTMVVPVPADGAFSACWARVWPPDANLAGLLYTSTAGGGANRQATLGQANTTLGTDYDAAGLLAHRLTARAPWVAALAGLALGYAAARTRRLEIASALHARVPKAHLAWQHLLEAALWVGAAGVITAAALLWVARTGNPDPSWTTWLTGARAVVAAGVACLLGVLAAVLATREKHLFRYTKDR